MLRGTGSNVYNASLAQALARLGHDVHLLEGRHRPDLVAHPRDELGLELVDIDINPRLEHDQASWQRTLELVVDPDHGAFGHGRVTGQSRLD